MGNKQRELIQQVSKNSECILIQPSHLDTGNQLSEKLDTGNSLLEKSNNCDVPEKEIPHDCEQNEIHKVLY